ncbi:MAG TPA: GNAT family N-acetyltransferase [Nitrococcus sp.]|nr:GNAT family N-acetyltransferase [Nitrococcus sp.]
MAEVNLLGGSWDELGRLAAAVRRRVFVDEQGIPAELEWDALDSTSRHWVAVMDPDGPIGTVRLTAQAHVGRMAVLPAWRRRGIGTRLLQAVLEEAAAAGFSAVALAAQLPVIPFYERLHFESYGEIFQEAGIPHRMMRRALGRHHS